MDSRGPAKAMNEPLYNFRCEKCNARYRHFSGLKRHMENVHHGVKFQCNHCKRSWIRKESASRHLKIAGAPCSLAGFSRISAQEGREDPSSSGVHPKSADSSKKRSMVNQATISSPSKKVKSVVVPVPKSTMDLGLVSSSSSTHGKHHQSKYGSHHSHHSSPSRERSKFSKEKVIKPGQDSSKPRVSKVSKPSDPRSKAYRSQAWTLAPIDCRAATGHVIPKIYVEQSKIFVEVNTMTDPIPKPAMVDQATQCEFDPVEYLKQLFAECVHHVAQMGDRAPLFVWPGCNQEQPATQVPSEPSGGNSDPPKVTSSEPEATSVHEEATEGDPDVVSLFGGSLSDDSEFGLEEGELPSSPDVVCISPRPTDHSTPWKPSR